MAAVDQFGANVRRLRRAAGWSQMELGRRSSLDFTAISRLERATREPRLLTILKLARGLDVPPSELLDGLPLDELT